MPTGVTVWEGAVDGFRVPEFWRLLTAPPGGGLAAHVVCFAEVLGLVVEDDGAAAARPRGERTRPVPEDASAPPSPLRPGRLTVEVGDPAGGAPWRGRYHLVVIDGEVLLFPRRVDDPPFRFRAYAGREATATALPTPTARAVEAALCGLVRALQAQLDATNRDGAS